ncbi:MAG: hypothetical protein M3N95_10515 [Actinomycetota bacterium]|nr:hypothetical protein [Actinomycetota bacterium]
MRRRRRDGTPDAHLFPTRPYDLVKEFVVAVVVVGALTLALAAVFSSPDRNATSFWYQIRPFSTSANADVLVWAVMAVLTLGLIFLPFIPGLRSLPRHLRVHRLIWRDQVRCVAPQEASGTNHATAAVCIDDTWFGQDSSSSAAGRSSAQPLPYRRLASGTRDDGAVPYNVEWLEPDPWLPAGPEPSSRRLTGRYLMAIAVVASAGIVAVAHYAGSRPDAHPVVLRRPVVLADLGRPLLGIAGDPDLYVRTATAVVRVRLSRGRVTSTALPLLHSTGPVSFVPLPSGVLVRPLDFVPGYFIPDAGPPVLLSGPLANGPALPGPQPGELWVTDNSGGSTSASELVLLAADGSKVDSVRIPTSAFGPPNADGQGYLLVDDPRGGVEDVRPGGVEQLVRDGVVLASGAGRWLTAACQQGVDCPATLVTTGGSTGSALHPQPVDASWPLGRISPDGGQAAVFRGAGPERLMVALVDLHSGSARLTSVRVGANADANSIAFSPDGSWLFVADESGLLDAVNVGTGAVRGLGVVIQGALQVTVRG